MLTEYKTKQIEKRKRRIRKKVSGTAERPRLSMRRSHLNLFVQAIDDMTEKTLFSSSTLSVQVKGKRKQWGNVEAAREFGLFVGDELKKKNILKIVFDRGGRAYHGRIKVFAEALRESGIQF